MPDSPIPIDVLLVENIADDAVHLTHLLGELPICATRCQRCSRLGEALALLRDGSRPDIVFLDLDLPDAQNMDGLDLLLAYDPELLIVALLGPERQASSLEVIEAGAQDYLHKDQISLERLARVLRFALYRGRSDRILKGAAAAAESAIRAKSELLSKISRELRTPLNAIIGFTDLFESEFEETRDARRDRWLADLDSMRQAQGHLLQWIDEMLELAHLESGKVELERAEFSPAQLFEAVRIEYEEAAAEYGNTIRLAMDRNVPDFLVGDLRRIRGIVSCLVSNANKFTRDGEISISVAANPAHSRRSADASELTFSVKDNGVGIPEHLHEVIFEEFRQGNDAHSSRGDGLGLGLTICRQLCRLMNGDVKISSQEGTGTTAEVSIVLHKPMEPARAESARQTTGETGSLSGRRAVVVEDDEAFRQVLARSLEYVGIRVAHFASAEEAEANLAEHPEVDILLVDLHLPGKNGIELLRNFRRRRTAGLPPPRIIVATGDRSEEWRHECEAVGGAEILLKPFSVEALCERVASPQ